MNRMGSAGVLVGLLAVAMPWSAPAQVRPATGRIQTVTGPIDPSALGFTLPHEHLFIDFLLTDIETGYQRTGPPPPAFVRRFQQLGNISWIPRTAEELAFWDRPTLTIDMLERLRNRWQTKTNYVLDDESEAIDEVQRYLSAGGRSLVDVTPVGIGREPVRLRRIAERTGLTIVMGTSFYRWPYRSDSVRALTAEAMADRMVRDLTEGIDGTGIRAGIIGEIPVDAHSVHLEGPLDRVPSDSAVRALWQPRYQRIGTGSAVAEEIYDPEEIKSLKAAAWASRRTGAAITLHAVDPWIGYLDVLEREGADLGRVVIGHGGGVLADTAMARRAFARGVTLQLDWEMQEMATGASGPAELLLDRVAWAVRNGFVRQITLSLDVCLKVGRRRYGGGGLTQVQDRLLPGLRKRGVAEADLRIITVENPRRILTLIEPTPRPAAQDLAALRIRLQARLTALHAGSNVPGVTAGIVLADGRSIGLAAGLADTGRRTPMTPASRLPSGSTGKTFVAAIVLQLVAEGKVRLDDPIARWFAHEVWFRRLPNGSATTVRMLLDHTSGIPDHVIERAFIADLLAVPERTWKPEELIGYVLDAKPYGPAGSAFHYTDTNYVLLGMLIERATGSPYYAELRRRLLDPLQLRGIVPNDRLRIPEMAQGYSGGLERSLLDYGKEAVESPPAPGSVAAADAMLRNGAFVVNPQFEWTGGGLATTAVDLARWAKAVYEAKVFPQPLLDEAVKGTPDPQTHRYYGLGVGVAETPDGPRWGHGGFYPGYRTVMAYFPKQRVAVVVQTNTTAAQANSFSEQFVTEALRLVTGAAPR